MPRTIERYGWRPQLPDPRDYELEVDHTMGIPPEWDLRQNGHLPPIYDQGNLGSCTANAIAAALDYDNHRQTGEWITPSRLFIYRGERVLEGTVKSDSGAEIRDGMKVVAKQGAPPESEWPYQVTKFADKPPAKVTRAARADRALTYKAVAQTPHVLRLALHMGLPVVFGFSVFESFESDAVTRTGVVPMPKPGEACIGGHAVVAVGYHDASERYIVRNSWGDSWGDGGHFTLPYDYVGSRSLAADFWVIETTTEPTSTEENGGAR